MNRHPSPWLVVGLGLMVMGVLIWSGIQPKDRLTWWMEIAPVLLGAVALTITYRFFPLTRLAYVLVAGHMVLLAMGGHYTYEGVPLFNWLQEPMGWSRNHYDRLGHFVQGFVPAIVAREIFIRRQVTKSEGWTVFLAICFCLAFSGFFELLEWKAAIWMGAASNAFLGSQGDPWDAQTDMGWALAGAITAMTFLRRWHNRDIRTVQGGVERQNA